MGKEKEASQTLSKETKLYLGEVFTTLRAHWTLLSLAGMSHGRSRIGFINELSIDTIKFLVGDDEFLFGSANEDGNRDPHKYLWDKEKDLQNNPTTLIDSSLLPWQTNMLTKLRVVLEWGKDVANEKNPQGSFADTPIGKGIQMVGVMLDPLVDKPEFSNLYESMKNNPQALSIFARKLELEIKDMKASK